ncbi:unnamed protein product [Adineta ricciae]|uniref:Uncharacterized protein n=1 Tax=Adineta ricciae TaxID=249248 RepID=A0A815X7D9_ADIRI|nr:unnamed protein product [Adineta ricciae]
MIKNIKLMNAAINLYTKSPNTTGECNINVVVHRNNNINQIALTQYCSRFSNGLVESLIGVMIFDPISMKIYFSTVDNKLNSQETAEQAYRVNSIASFRTNMLNANGIELFGDDAEQLIKHVTTMEEDVDIDSDDEAKEFEEESYD